MSIVTLHSAWTMDEVRPTYLNIQYSDELILILKSTDIEVQWKTRPGVICAQGCINCAIQLSGIGARGVSSEHMENMEMFSCSPT